jgi:hypothetical protein
MGAENFFRGRRCGGWSRGWLGGRGRIFGGHGKVMVVNGFILNPDTKSILNCYRSGLPPNPNNGGFETTSGLTPPELGAGGRLGQICIIDFWIWHEVIIRNFTVPIEFSSRAR